MGTRKKKKNKKTPQKKATNWVDYISNEDFKLMIPVGPRFQAVVPEWTAPRRRTAVTRADSTTRWLGTAIWPIKGLSKSRESKRDDVIGKGRQETCVCSSPGSEQCVKKHITEKKIKLQSDLGPAFWRMKFDNMGEEITKWWSLDEEKKFESLVKSEECFLKPASTILPSHNRESIVSYYFNVYVLRRFSTRTRLGRRGVDTDGEEDELVFSKGSAKRPKVDSVVAHNSRYLTGRR